MALYITYIYDLIAFYVPLTCKASITLVWTFLLSHFRNVLLHWPLLPIARDWHVPISYSSAEAPASYLVRTSLPSPATLAPTPPTPGFLCSCCHSTAFTTRCFHSLTINAVCSETNSQCPPQNSAQGRGLDQCLLNVDK